MDIIQGPIDQCSMTLIKVKMKLTRDRKIKIVFLFANNSIQNCRRELLIKFSTFLNMIMAVGLTVSKIGACFVSES